jgi:hypothetical protein
MKFLIGNLINTTTMIGVDSGTLTVKNIFNPDKVKQWVSSGYNDDTLTEELTVTFSGTTTIDAIALKQHNLKEFKIFYDGLTANVFSIVDGATSSIDYNACAEVNHFFNCQTVACASITLSMKKTQTVNSEKAVGFLSNNLCQT